MILVGRELTVWNIMGALCRGKGINIVKHNGCIVVCYYVECFKQQGLAFGVRREVSSLKVHSVCIYVGLSY